MLNLEQIAQRIKHPEIGSKEEIDDLRELTIKYPYAQLFSILYLKALSTHNDIRFEDELTLHAYKITDRTQLYKLIHDSQQAEHSVSAPIEFKAEILEKDHTEEPNEVQTPIPVESVEPIDNSIKNEELLAPETAFIAASEPILSASEPVIQEEIQPEQTSIEEAVTITEEVTISSVNVEIDEFESEETDTEIPLALGFEREEKFEKEILSEAIVANYNLDHLAELNEIEVQEEEEETIEENEEVEEEWTPTPSHQIGKRSFSSWLRLNDNDVEESNPDKDRIDALVDQFIREEPSISRPKKGTEESEKPKKEFYSPVKKAKESLDVANMPVSETLAKIFALQGNFPKAIFAYEQLMLSNPEKMVFFASQIEQLKKKLNT